MSRVISRKKYLTYKEYDTLDDGEKIIAILNGSAPKFKADGLNEMLTELDELIAEFERIASEKVG
jgi:hypothetical protein